MAGPTPKHWGSEWSLQTDYGCCVKKRTFLKARSRSEPDCSVLTSAGSRMGTRFRRLGLWKNSRERSKCQCINFSTELMNLPTYLISRNDGQRKVWQRIFR